MKILFDARYIRTDFHDGVSRYSAELGSALAAEHDDVTFIICDPAQQKFLPKGATCILFYKPTAWREPLASLFLNKYHPDVVISPMQTIGSFGKKFKLVVTVHDLIYYRHRRPPSGLSWMLGLGWRLYHLSYWPQRLVLKGADIIATVSQTSKHDIEAAKLTKRSVIVVPNAPQKLGNLLSRALIRHKHPKNLVYMGSFMPYKNVETLIRGMAFLPDHTLHLLSKIAPARRQELEKLCPSGVTLVFHNGVSDKEYAHLLADKALLVSASLDEGYGIPLAESLALGVPVVVSDLAIFHEVAGEGGVYFSAQSPEAFAEAVVKASEPAMFRQLSIRGTKHIAQFNWRRSARMLLDALNK